jgi:N-acetylglucosamine-6-phosphate deacetylase
MPQRSPVVLGNARVALADRVLAPGWVSVGDGRIDRFGDGPPPPGVMDLDCQGLWLAPGFVDMHVHGGGGGAFDSGDHADIVRAAEFHRAHGTTTLLASLVSAPLDALERQIATLATCVAEGIVDGIHLEGPWLSPARRGAHDPRALRPPTTNEVHRLLGAGRGTVRMVTLAPELPGTDDAIRTLTRDNIVAAIGHTDASYAQTRQAIKAGARVATHVFNAMRPLHQREPGPLLAVLEDERITLEVIADGRHVHDALLRWLIAAAGSQRVALVTDAISAAGMGDGTFALGGLEVAVKHGVARLAADPAALAGSTLTMAEAVRHTVEKLGVSVPAAARMASHTPARALGLPDVGDIRVGARADLVLLDDEAHLRATMRRGQWAENS